MKRSARLALLAALGLWPAMAHAQGPDNVLVVINDASPASVQIGETYARKRVIPQDHIVRLKTVTTDSVEREGYVASIEAPIASWIFRHNLHDRVLYIVLTKGIPLRVNGTGGSQGTVASVDSELTLLYRKMTGVATTVTGRTANSYYLGDRPMAEARPFSRLTSDIYLVTRLDGFTVEDVLGLIERGSAPSQNGRIVLDQKATLIDRGGDQWLAQANDRLGQAGAGDRVVFETTTAIAKTSDPVLGYFSWGSNDPAAQLRRFGFTFVSGAIGGMFVSTDGRTFAEPPATWKPSNPSGGPLFGGSFQSLAGDLIRDGITGVSAHVTEPLLDATIRPHILFPAYLSGLNLAESYYLAMPFLSWQTLVVGDPLCAPFQTAVVTPERLHKGLDEATDLPALFAERRLAALNTQNYNAEALRLVLRAEVLLARDAKTAVDALLIRATDLDSRLVVAQMRLAATHEGRGEYDQAIERYRKILVTDPQNAVALNNLAYALAVHKSAPGDALPYAERAARVAPSAAVLDTLAWVHHLKGDDRSALPFIERAAALAPKLAEVRWHAASIHVGLRNIARARVELDEALKLDPTLENRAEIKALKESIK